MRTFLKVMLYLLVPQLLIMGGLALAAPELAARIWNFPLKDPALARVVGPPWIALGILCLIMAQDLDRYRPVIWVPFLGTWLQFGRAVHGLLSGELAPAVAKSQIAWEGISGVLLLVAYFGAYRRTS
ncbi:MAG: hypothetical protein HY215_00385 [Candidatus Rokubacteria bacterium]|nr:hypothetical protein [Candidatus Rokubacteria bacterium]